MAPHRRAVVGGWDLLGRPLTTTEIYDPAAGAWQPGAASAQEPDTHTRQRAQPTDRQQPGRGIAAVRGQPIEPYRRLAGVVADRPL